MIQKIENCTYCGDKMKDVKSAKRKFCNDKCRIYYGRELKRGTLDIPVRSSQIEAKFEARKDELLSNQNTLVINDKKPIFIERKTTILDDYGNEIVDYQKEYNMCEFTDEYKALWLRINSDQMVSQRDKNTWKIRLNVK